jgi:hypothetical protein
MLAEMTNAEVLKVVNAAERGEEIEQLSANGGCGVWGPKIGYWDFMHFRYRVKTAPKPLELFASTTFAVNGNEITAIDTVANTVEKCLIKTEATLPTVSVVRQAVLFREVTADQLKRERAGTPAEFCYSQLFADYTKEKNENERLRAEIAALKIDLRSVQAKRDRSNRLLAKVVQNATWCGANLWNLPNCDGREGYIIDAATKLLELEEDSQHSTAELGNE